MKQNKKEELQSRRQFFKKAAKAALPILGAIALANVPMIAKAGETTGGCKTCTDACTGKCRYGCVDGCLGKCKATCQEGCVTYCSGSCKANCQSSSH